MSATVSTLNHVAMLAGVSKTTASLILNNRQIDQFSPETRQRVLQMAKDLRYQPRGRRRQRVEPAVKAVAFMLGEKLGPQSDRGGYFGGVLDGLQDAAGRRGIQVVVGTNLADARDQRSFVEGLRAASIGGVITGTEMAPDVMQQFADWGVPVICAGDVSSCGENTIQVCGNNYEGGRIATRHLLGLGHTRIAWLGYLSQRPFFVQRLSGYLSAMLEAGVATDPDLVWRPRAEDRLVDVFDRGLEAGPTAIFASSSELALRTLEELYRRGVAIPDRISLVAYDDWPVFETWDPPVTTLAVSPEQVGVLALNRLLGLVGDGESDMPAHTNLLEVKLIVRGSTRAVASSSI